MKNCVFQTLLMLRNYTESLLSHLMLHSFCSIHVIDSRNTELDKWLSVCTACNSLMLKGSQCVRHSQQMKSRKNVWVFFTLLKQIYYQ